MLATEWRDRLRARSGAAARRWAAIAAGLLVAAAVAQAQTPPDTTPVRRSHTIDWGAVRGVEISALPPWGKDFDVERADRLLALAQGMGFNAVKTWLTSEVYFSDPEGTLASVARFLDLCERRDLDASFLLFHTGGGSTTAVELGREVEWIPAEEALERSDRARQ